VRRSQTWSPTRCSAARTSAALALLLVRRYIAARLASAPAVAAILVGWAVILLPALTCLYTLFQRGTEEPGRSRVDRPGSSVERIRRGRTGRAP
jgi:hypothetical protein